MPDIVKLPLKPTCRTCEHWDGVGLDGQRAKVGYCDSKDSDRIMAAATHHCDAYSLEDLE